MRISADSLLYDTCLSEVMQLIQADSISNGAKFQWKHFFDPSPELMAEFDKLSNQELPELW